MLVSLLILLTKQLTEATFKKKDLCVLPVRKGTVYHNGQGKEESPVAGG